MTGSYKTKNYLDMELKNINNIKGEISELPLFSNLDNNDESQNYESNDKINFCSGIGKYYATNFCLFFLVIASIIFMFCIQFKIDDLQTSIVALDKEISAYKSEINILEVEWVYLTRPERLRILSNKYLENSKHINPTQVKDVATLQKYYFARLKKYETENLAMN